MTSPEPIPDPLRLTVLRSLAYGELTDAEAQAVQAAVDADPRARARLAALRAEAAAFTGDAATASVRILERLEEVEAPPPVALAGWRRLVPLFAVAAGALVVAPLVNDETSGPETTLTTRTKGGGAGLVMFVKDAEGVRRAQDGARLTAGDAIQFRYDAGGHPHLFVVSVDARGVVSPLYPDRAGASLAVQPEGTHVLEGSVILDDAVGPERIFAIFSDRPRRFEELEAAARRALDDGAALDGLSRLPVQGDDVEQVSVLLHKE